MIRSSLQALVVLPIEASLRAELTYDETCPYAVTLTLYDPLAHEWVPWVMGRDLLAAGTQGVAGIGDVWVWPLTELSRLRVAISSSDETMTLSLPLALVVSFIRATYVRVPRGTESDHIDMDEVIERLLEST